ncbi:hypothetical protein [Cyanobium sp. ATX-6F1]|uniref:hypothetical protein n=1 Tax=Cyanobium sp. ATX-6F1 TaxID=3137388 RepID=UPI0039BE27F2
MAEGWLPAAFNRGWTYRDRIGAEPAGATVLSFYAARYRHSDRAVWTQRLAAGELHRNGSRLRADAALLAGDQLQWHRPPGRRPPCRGRGSSCLMTAICW